MKIKIKIRSEYWRDAVIMAVPALFSALYMHSKLGTAIHPIALIIAIAFWGMITALYLKICRKLFEVIK